MSSKIATVAADVVTYLNDPARGYAMPFTATRRYVPKFDLPELSTLTVCVSGINRRRSRITRAAFQKTIAVNIGVIQRLAQGSDPEASAGLEEADALLSLAEQIEDSFESGEFGGTALDPEQTTLAFDQGKLQADNIFFSVISLSFYYIE